MLPHVSIDGELVKLPRNPPAGFYNPTVDNGGLEELCSVLTIAVGRHFFLVVNIVHMLESPTEHTVPALAAFYERTLFNPDYLKLWWNPGSDISVLDDTIAHMYQATQRPSYQHTPWLSTSSTLITPRFRINSPHFSGHRPNNLRFPLTQAVCDLHAPGANERGIYCCCRLGNIDLATLLNHYCRTHGKPTAALRWDQYRPSFNYSQLLTAMLGSDRLYPILDFMKDRANDAPAGKHAFYQGLGQPGMETDDDAMAYIIGDVAGQNLVFEQTIFSDDIQLVGSSIDAYNGYITAHTRIPTRLRDQCDTEWSLTDTSGILLIEDVPLVHANIPYKPEDPEEVRGTNDCFWRTERLRPWEHDHRVLLGRNHPIGTASGRHPTAQAVPYCRPAGLPDRTLSMGPFLNELYDPRKIWVPPTCAIVDQQSLQPEYDNPVIRAGTTHMEALIEFLRSPQALNASPPNGFGAPPGTPYGLPTQLGRTPGRSLQHPRNIYDAFQAGPKPYQNALGATVRTHQDRLELQPGANLGNEIQRVITEAGDLLVPDNRLGLQDRLQRAQQILRLERQQNAYHGLPSQLDASDPYDPEGRELRMRCVAAAPWNQPLQPYLPPTYTNGSWRSQASDIIAAFRQHTSPAIFGLLDARWDTDRNNPGRYDIAW